MWTQQNYEGYMGNDTFCVSGYDYANSQYADLFVEAVPFFQTTYYNSNVGNLQGVVGFGP